MTQYLAANYTAVVIAEIVIFKYDVYDSLFTLKREPYIRHLLCTMVWYTRV